MPCIELRACARPARVRASASLRAPLIGLAAFLGYVAWTAWAHRGFAPPVAEPASGCVLLLAYMAWPAGYAVRTFGRRNVPGR